jgi:D-alanyl-D-alanine carboxypeptidase
VPNGDRITIRMLGNMTSGLFNYTDDEYLWSTNAASNFTISWPPDSLLAVSFRHPVNFEPGTQYEYCNTNTVLLGLLLQKVTGKHPSDVIAETVLRPLNLAHTYWGGSYFLNTPYTRGYNYDSGPVVDATNFNPSWGYTAGALISTIPDMKIWAKALAEGALLSDAMRAERFTWVGNHYGFCVMKVLDWIGHPGSITGYNSHVLYKPSKKMTMIVYTNMDTGSPVEDFSQAYRDILDKL